MKNYLLYVFEFFLVSAFVFFEKGKEKRKINDCRPEETQELTTHQNIFLYSMISLQKKKEKKIGEK